MTLNEACVSSSEGVLSACNISRLRLHATHSASSWSLQIAASLYTKHYSKGQTKDVDDAHKIQRKDHNRTRAGTNIARDTVQTENMYRMEERKHKMNTKRIKKERKRKERE